MKTKFAALKICFVAWEYPPVEGGVAKSADRIVKYLLEEGLDVHVITPVFAPQDYKAKSVPMPVIENGATIYRVSLPKTSALVGAQMLYETLKYLDDKILFDIFHGFFLPAAYPCIMVARKTERPVVSSMRGSDAAVFLKNKNHFSYLQTVLQQASWITSNSTDLLKIVSEVSDVQGRSSFIPNSINSTGFPEWQLTEENCGVVGTAAIFKKKRIYHCSWIHMPI